MDGATSSIGVRAGGRTGDGIGILDVGTRVRGCRGSSTTCASSSFPEQVRPFSCVLACTLASAVVPTLTSRKLPKTLRVFKRCSGSCARHHAGTDCDSPQQDILTSCEQNSTTSPSERAAASQNCSSASNAADGSKRKLFTRRSVSSSSKREELEHKLKVEF